MFAEGIKAVISSVKEFALSGVSYSLDELVKKITKEKPNVLIYDINIGNNDIHKTMDIIKANSPKTRVIVISDTENIFVVRSIVNSGVNSYLFNCCDYNEVVNAVHATYSNEKFFCGKVLDLMLEDPKIHGNCDPIKLSTREVEILKLIAEGLSTKEITNKLFLSIHTVNTHRKNIIRKIGVKSPAELVKFAIKNGLVNS